MRADVEEIHKAGLRAADLTRQLLLFSRQQAMDAKVIDVNALLSGMKRMLCRLVGEDVELTFHPAATPTRVLVDPGQFEQVVMNLVVNARDAMPTGGKLTVEVTELVVDETFAKDHHGMTAGPHVMLSVSDSGVGMSRETQEHVFDPFFTTKPPGFGTGLGLSTVFGIVKQAHGGVWVYSELGKGTTFKVYLPTAAPAVAPFRATVPPVNLCGTETILLVEDDDQLRVVARTMLQRFGYRVIEAGGPLKALDIAERRGHEIDLLLTDVVMPGMSGPELARRMAESRPGMRVLCMSGYTDDAVVRHGLVGSGIAFLQKPITPDRLTRKVREVLDAAQRASPAPPSHTEGGTT